MTDRVYGDVSLWSDDDIYLFNEGKHFGLWRHMGAHLTQRGGTAGVVFSVWAPNAQRVFVMGGFNGWNKSSHELHPRQSSGIFEGFVPGLGPGTNYKFHIVSSHDGSGRDKADPFGVHHENPPRTASIVWDPSYTWHDEAWMNERAARQHLGAPMNVYEVHLGSWRRVPEDGGRSMSYVEIAGPLAQYVCAMGFTHVEFLPLTEHPFYGSWGYQATGYFAPTSRYGTPEQLKYLIDVLHQHGIGVILDWVPSHFPSDDHGLAVFDGTHLFEHADPRKGFHPDWKSAIFNYSRHEVRSFLISSAMYWLDEYHIDGLRVDAVASMLYLDYSRDDGEWIPNAYGGRENLEAISLLQELNTAIYAEHPDAQTIAEESTAWPNVSRPTYVGGLGFGLKWDMGWMHDTLTYLRRDPVHRSYHHHEVTFRAVYAHTENYMMPLSHDEVVHGKGSLIDQMPGDLWQRFANLRILFGYMHAQPGKNLVFMGGEFGQWREWSHDRSLDWHLVEGDNLHAGVQGWVRDLNTATRECSALHELDADSRGFEWIDRTDSERSVLSFLRWDAAFHAPVLVVCNFTPVVHYAYRLGVPFDGAWAELLNSDAESYGGSGVGNLGGVMAEVVPAHGHHFSVSLTLAPLSVAMFLGSR
ncbi:MAG: 1,4-alpha-glucan branching protein GlgB [Myxococcota bacterium]